MVTLISAFPHSHSALELRLMIEDEKILREKIMIKIHRFAQMYPCWIILMNKLGFLLQDLIIKIEIFYQILIFESVENEDVMESFESID